MYKPIQDGIEKKHDLVSYIEVDPPKNLSAIVHCFWELKTESILKEDFYLHVLPDACINILFNQIDTEVAGITSLNTEFKVLNLGKEFHFVGIQFLPGVWRGNVQEIVSEYVGTAYKGHLPLIEISKKMSLVNFQKKQFILSKLVQAWIAQGLVTENSMMEKILTSIDTISSVSDMSDIAELSPRQLQRTIKEKTMFSPHNLLKVLRLQRSFKRGYLGAYTDQSHFIKSFKKITGYTPQEYARKFHV